MIMEITASNMEITMVENMDKKATDRKQKTKQFQKRRLKKQLGTHLMKMLLKMKCRPSMWKILDKRLFREEFHHHKFNLMLNIQPM